MNTPELSVRVARKTMEAVDICSFELVAADGRSLPPFAAGSHIDVQLPGGLTRQYSLCNDPTDRHRYLIAVLLDAATRGGSLAMHRQVDVGTLLNISAPKNHFALAHGAADSLLLAGGIGITPILCMAERLAVSGASFRLHYAARSRQRAAFCDRIAASAFAQQVQFHFDDGPPGQRLDIAAALAAGGQPSSTHLYVCGPKGYIDAVLGLARALGWPDERLHCEFFAAAPATHAGDAGFSVQLASSGRIVAVAAGQTVVDALAGAGVDIPVSCGQGVCGTCLTRVLSGEPEHNDLILSAEEQSRNDQFTPCCSRSRSPLLVLDL